MQIEDMVAIWVEQWESNETPNRVDPVAALLYLILVELRAQA